MRSTAARVRHPSCVRPSPAPRIRATTAGSRSCGIPVRRQPATAGIAPIRSVAIFSTRTGSGAGHGPRLPNIWSKATLYRYKRSRMRRGTVWADSACDRHRPGAPSVPHPDRTEPWPGQGRAPCEVRRYTSRVASFSVGMRGSGLSRGAVPTALGYSSRGWRLLAHRCAVYPAGAGPARTRQSSRASIAGPQLVIREPRLKCANSRADSESRVVCSRGPPARHGPLVDPRQGDHESQSSTSPCCLLRRHAPSEGQARMSLEYADSVRPAVGEGLVLSRAAEVCAA